MKEMTQGPSRPHEKTRLWTEAEFDEMSWHDNHVHGFQIRASEHGLGELTFDIDYILEWLCPAGSDRCQFRIAPASLTFVNVSDLKIQIDYAAASAALGPFSIGDVKRTPMTFPTGATIFGWTIELNWPPGFISFEASRLIYNAVLAVVVIAQFLVAWPVSWSKLTFDLLVNLFVLAVLANIAYCAVYLADLFVQFAGLHHAWQRGRVALLIIGTAFGAALAHFIIQSAL
jgi:hypothetical protein